MSLAERTRDAARDHPFLVDGLAAGIVNYTAAARYLRDRDDLSGEEEAIATALRRFADDLDQDGPAGDGRVSMERGLGQVEAAGGNDALLSVGDRGFAPGGDYDAVVAHGEFGVGVLERVLGRLRTAGVEVVATGARKGSLAVVVGRMDGADAVRVVEAVLEG